MNLFLIAFSCFLIFEIGSATILDRYISRSTVCANYCDASYNISHEPNLVNACQKGCRLFTVIGLAKDEHSCNKTEALCFSACQEAYQWDLMMKTCNEGCQKQASVLAKSDENPQTLHLLTPLMWVKSAYKTAAHNLRQLITTSFTLYVQEDSGKMVVLQTKPKMTVVNLHGDEDDSESKHSDKNTASNTWQAVRTDWMDCISQQSGLPRWILVSVLFGFIIALLWLCCVTTVTAPSHHISSAAKKLAPKNDIQYLYLYDPIDEFKVQPPSDVDAPPLPLKVNLG